LRKKGNGERKKEYKQSLGYIFLFQTVRNYTIGGSPATEVEY